MLKKKNNFKIKCISAFFLLTKDSISKQESKQEATYRNMTSYFSKKVKLLWLNDNGTEKNIMAEYLNKNK